MKPGSTDLSLTASGIEHLDPRLLEALENLNQISRAINDSLGERVPDYLHPDDITQVLRLIVESAGRVVPDASAVIYSLAVSQDPQTPGVSDSDTQGASESDSEDRGITALQIVEGFGEKSITHAGIRSDGLGARAYIHRQRILSYEHPDLNIHPQKALAGARTVACFPMTAANEVVGLLYVYLFATREFSPIELLMLENLVNQAAMAVYQQRQFSLTKRVLARKDEELRHLRRAGLLISSRPRLQETLEAILQMALEVTDARYGIFRLVDEGGQNLVTRAIAGDQLAQPLVEALPINARSVMSWVAKERQPVLIHDLQSQPWSAMYYPLDADLVMRSELAVPLVGSSGRLEGVLNLESPEVGAFSEADSHLLQALATQAMVAIQEARLLDALQAVAQILLVLPYQEVLDHLVELACSLLNAEASVIWLRMDHLRATPAVYQENDASHLLLVSASPNYRDEGTSRQAGWTHSEAHVSSHHDMGQLLPVKNSLAGLAMSTRQPVVSEDIRTDDRFHRRELAVRQGWKYALVVPLLASRTNDEHSPDHRSEPIGAFSVYRSETDQDASFQGTFAGSEWDEKVLTCLAHYASLAVQNADRQNTLRTIQERNALAETFAAVGDIAANLLHNLNNKVGVIPVRVQGIQDKCQDALLANPYLDSGLKEIERSAVEAMAFVRDNLAHLHPIQMAPVDLNVCVQNALQQASLPPGVMVEIEGIEKLPLIFAGERSMVLVFSNLLENAAAAMDGEGTVNISGAASPNWIDVNVRDSGSGISPELHNIIFELNYSSLPPEFGPDKHKPGKLGFGLWWVKSVMNRLGGSVSVESDGRSGTTFHLRFPVSDLAE